MIHRHLSLDGPTCCNQWASRGSVTDHFFKSIGQNDLGDILSTSYFCSFTLGGL